MTSPSPEEARATLVEDIAAVLVKEPWAKSYDDEGAAWWSRALANVALDAALAARTEPETCEQCEGSGTDAIGASDAPCDVCHGSGSRSLYLLDVIRKGRDA